MIFNNIIIKSSFTIIILIWSLFHYLMIFKCCNFNEILILKFKFNFYICILNEILICFIYETPLFMAILSENFDMIKLLLLDKRIDINYIKVFI